MLIIALFKINFRRGFIPKSFVKTLLTGATYIIAIIPLDILR